MALHSDNMEQVAAIGDQPDTGSYLFRIAEVKEFQEDGVTPLVSNEGHPKIIVVAKIQDEGKFMGNQIQMHISLQSHALAGLKALYNAAGYKPGPEGHDPQNLVDAQFYGYGEQSEYIDKKDGSTKKGFSIAPWNITSVQDGPKKLRQ